MESKHQNVAFLSNENWLNDLAFLTDITHLSELNLKLQEKSQLVNKMFEHICAFEKKLQLFQVQLSRATLTHFTCLATRRLEFPFPGFRSRITLTMELVCKSCVMSLQTDLQISDKMKLN